MLVDYHLHTKLCGHAQGEMSEYVKKAQEMGLKEIGFAGHFPLLHLKDPTLTRSLTISKKDFPGYREEVLRLREQFPQIKIKFGCEVDYIPGEMEKVRELLSLYPDIDYIYGSVHFLGDWIVDHPLYISEFERRDLFEVYNKYFSLVQEAAKSGLFDILAHIDVIKKFGFSPSEDISPLWEKTVEVVKESNLVIELNTSGFRKPIGETFPGEKFLRLCYKKKIPITLGSDAHSPQEVGKDFSRALLLLKKVGYEEIAVFNRREWSLSPLNFKPKT